MKSPSFSSPRILIVLLAAALFSGTAGAVKFTPYASGFRMPTHIGSAGDDRLFIVEQLGTVRVIQGGKVAEQPFLDITDRVFQVPRVCCDEQGLLSIAFPPGFAEKRYFYVGYVDRANVIHVSRFHLSADDPNRANPDSEEILFSLAHKFQNHFGGQLQFHPSDGKLYFSIGDGAGGGDPLGTAQDETQYFGKILRMDVENGDYHPQIFALGLRNPWRFSMDRMTGDLYVGDVGDDHWEEANFAPHGAVGVNFGWSVLEGNDCFRQLGCDASKYTPPIFAFDHETGCSSTGGYVYRGWQIESLKGRYLFADFCTGKVWASIRHNGEWVTDLLMLDTLLNISSFGEDVDGELYVTDFLKGTIYKLEDGEPEPPEMYEERKRLGRGRAAVEKSLVP